MCLSSAPCASVPSGEGRAGWAALFLSRSRPTAASAYKSAQRLFYGEGAALLRGFYSCLFTKPGHNLFLATSLQCQLSCGAGFWGGQGGGGRRETPPFYGSFALCAKYRHLCPSSPLSLSPPTDLVGVSEGQKHGTLFLSKAETPQGRERFVRYIESGLAEPGS